MSPIARVLLAFVVSLVRWRLSLQIEGLALWHQLMVYKTASRRPHLRPSDRILWAWLARHCARWREVRVFVQPATVLAWQRQSFREHWGHLSRRGQAGRGLPHNFES